MNRDLRVELRADIDRSLTAGNWADAKAQLQRLWAVDRSASAASYIISCFETLRKFVTLIPCRLAILRSFVVEPVIPFVRAAGLLGGIEISPYVSDFDNYAQEILDPHSRLYQFNPDAVIFSVQTRDIAPALWETYTDHNPEERTAAAAALIANLRDWVGMFRSRSNANLIIHNFESPAHCGSGVLDAQGSDGQARSIQELNRSLRNLAQEQPGVYVLDYDGLVSRCGRAKFHDHQKWLTMRMPIAAANLPLVALEWLRFLHPLTGRIGKVLVTDLDNTLWGGVIGEDGLDGIQLGRDYPGAAYRAVQRVLRDLNHRGILLAIASKNNETDAMQVLEGHAGMVLRAEHFASTQINWNPKSESLRRIAQQLNVGLDSLVFLDDNPTERQDVRLTLPEVTVIELPADSMGYADAIRDCPLLERVQLSAEDAQRTAMYQQQKQREILQTSAASLEEFYTSLQQTVEVFSVTDESLVRVAQLLKKTNQFNTTTRRHSESQIAQFLTDPSFDVYAARVSDRFGDNGLVGVCITRCEGDVREIDTFLLSCRVIGRKVETAILSFLAEDTLSRGMRRLEGWFLPTPKNKVSAGIYKEHGFELVRETEEGCLWSFDVRNQSIACPRWMEFKCLAEREAGAGAHA